jgi:hypothetical protein
MRDHPFRWLIGVAITVALAVGLAWWNQLEPDLRVTMSQASNADLRLLDQAVENPQIPIPTDAVLKTFISFRVNFTNHSWKRGFVQSAELVPLAALRDFIDSRVTAIDRTSIGRGEQRTINFRAEIRSRGNFRVLSVNQTDRGPHVQVEPASETDLEVRFADNTGRSVTRFDDDRYKAGRVTLKSNWGPTR